MNNRPDKNKKTYPEGHFVGMWMGIGMAIFSGMGIPISIATKNYSFIGIGPAIGMSFGLAIGQSIEKKHKEAGKIRPLTDKEKRTRKLLLLSGIGLFVIGLIVFIWMYTNS